MIAASPKLRRLQKGGKPLRCSVVASPMTFSILLQVITTCLFGTD